MRIMVRTQQQEEYWAGNSDVFETLDTGIEKEKGTTIKCGMPFIIVALKHRQCLPKALSKII